MNHPPTLCGKLQLAKGDTLGIPVLCMCLLLVVYWGPSRCPTKSEGPTQLSHILLRNGTISCQAFGKQGQSQAGHGDVCHHFGQAAGQELDEGLRLTLPSVPIASIHICPCYAFLSGQVFPTHVCYVPCKVCPWPLRRENSYFKTFVPNVQRNAFGRVKNSVRFRQSQICRGGPCPTL